MRHVLQDEADEQYIAREDFNRGVSILKEFNLAFDILIFERQLPSAMRFVDRHPEQVFVLDHLGKPKIKAGEREPWAKNLAETRTAHQRVLQDFGDGDGGGLAGVDGAGVTRIFQRRPGSVRTPKVDGRIGLAGLSVGMRIQEMVGHSEAMDVADVGVSKRAIFWLECAEGVRAGLKQ